MVLDRKTNFFLGKTKKTQKTIFLRHYAARPQKDGFLVFPRKKMVFHAKTIFLLGKSWFSTLKPSFSSEKVGFPVVFDWERTVLPLTVCSRRT